MDDGQIDKEDYKFDLSLYIYISGYIDICIDLYIKYLYMHAYVLSCFTHVRLLANLWA